MQRGVEDAEPSAENVSAVATREMVDISLSALRMGAREVNIVCLERRNEMPAALEEIEEAEAEGIIMHPGLGPEAHHREGRHASWARRLSRRNGCSTRTSASTQLSTRAARAVRVRHHNHGHRAGASPRLSEARGWRRDFSPRGLIAVNPQTLMTSASGIFAGGDCVFGPRLIIDSVADGKSAAVGIDEFLRGRKHPEPIFEVEFLKRHAMPLDYLDINRQPIPMLPLERRTGVTEVEIGYDVASAMEEAQRCLHCWVNTIFEGCRGRRHLCILCGGCVDVCPERLPGTGFARSDRFHARYPAAIRDNQECFGVELDEVLPTNWALSPGPRC